MEIIMTTNWRAGHQAGFKKLNNIVALKKQFAYLQLYCNTKVFELT